MRNIEEVLEELKDKSETGNPGKRGAEVVVDKELLKEAATYLEDFLVLQGRG